MMVLLALAARAEVGVDATSGAVTAPTAEMLPPGKMAFAFGLSSQVSTEGLQLGALPFGAGFSYSKDTEVGIHLDIQGETLANPSFDGTRVGITARHRLLGRDEVHTPLVLELDATGITGEWGAQLTAVTGFKVGEFGVYPSLGVGWRESDSAAAEVQVAVARYLHKRLRMLGEVGARVGLGGLQSADARVGLRVAAYRRAHVIAWAGGGWAGGAPWGGGGVTLALYAVDPLEVDRDDDGISDWTDTCPHAAEDKDRFEDDDGCPDPDNDQDGIPDALDETPNGETVSPTKYKAETPLLRMRIHERGFPGEDPDAP